MKDLTNHFTERISFLSHVSPLVDINTTESNPKAPHIERCTKIFGSWTFSMQMTIQVICSYGPNLRYFSKYLWLLRRNCDAKERKQHYIHYANLAIYVARNEGSLEIYYKTPRNFLLAHASQTYENIRELRLG